MRKLVIAASLLLTASCAACSVYPLPQEITGYDTYSIEAIFRCQMRDAVRQYAMGKMEDFDDIRIYNGMTGRQLRKRLTDDPDYFADLKIDQFIPEIRNSFKLYSKVEVAYDFTLDGSEMNSQGAQIDLLRSINRRSDTLGFGLSADRTRQVRRTFRVFDNFIGLAQKKDANYCANLPQLPNYVHPSVGRTRMDDLVGQFLNANDSGNLATKKDFDNRRAMSDTIVFTTKLNGSASPSFSLGPVGPGFNLNTISFTNTNYRQDLHQVIVTLAMPPEKETPNTLIPGNQKSPDSRREYASSVVDRVRQKNVDDAILSIANSLSAFR